MTTVGVGERKEVNGQLTCLVSQCSKDIPADECSFIENNGKCRREKESKQLTDLFSLTVFKTLPADECTFIDNNSKCGREKEG